MELRDYMAVRRAYNIVRQKTESSERLTFEEFAILCRLDLAGEPLRTTEIARYQGALRPTMTHRANRLVGLGLIERCDIEGDRRIICCKLSDSGKVFVEQTCRRIHSSYGTKDPLYGKSTKRVRNYMNAVGSVFSSSGDLVLLELYRRDPHVATVSELVEALGYLQPTVSMSVAALASRGSCLREEESKSGNGHRGAVVLTDRGAARAAVFAKRIKAIVVTRGGI